MQLLLHNLNLLPKYLVIMNDFIDVEVCLHLLCSHLEHIQLFLVLFFLAASAQDGKENSLGPEVIPGQQGDVDLGQFWGGGIVRFSFQKNFLAAFESVEGRSESIHRVEC